MATPIKLTEDEMAAGMLISDSGVQYRAALNAISTLEAQYIAQLRAKYGVGDEWGIRRWLTGLERAGVEGELHGEPND